MLGNVAPASSLQGNHTDFVPNLQHQAVAVDDHCVRLRSFRIAFGILLVFLIVAVFACSSFLVLRIVSDEEALLEWTRDVTVRRNSFSE